MLSFGCMYFMMSLVYFSLNDFVTPQISLQSTKRCKEKSKTGHLEDVYNPSRKVEMRVHVECIIIANLKKWRSVWPAVRCCHVAMIDTDIGTSAKGEGGAVKRPTIHPG